MKAFGHFLRMAAALVAFAGLTAAPSALAAGPSGAALLVAAPELAGPYARTVILALPVGAGTHIGFILNRPTETSLAALLPDYAPAKSVTSPVFVGGPELAGNLFALVRSPLPPAEGAVKVLPGLFMAYEEADVVQVIARFPGRARFFAGLVAWTPGELEAESGAGAWYLLDPDIELALEGSVDTLWTRLMARIQSVVARERARSGLTLAPVANDTPAVNHETTEPRAAAKLALHDLTTSH
jgi:putative transcriptional regulator